MPLASDFHDILETFIIDNLPLLTNPNAARNVVFTDAILPTTPTAPITPTTPSTTPQPASPATPVIIVTPQVLLALQTAVLNNFNDLDLPSDLQDIARIFFANLPPTTVTSPFTSTPV